MDNEKVITALNTLIVINNDRMEGYKTAGIEIEEIALKGLFAQFSQTSQSCRQELEREVIRLDGTPDQGTDLSSKFHRVWMDLKAVFNGNDENSILGSCEYGDEAAINTYKDLLSAYNEDLSTEQKTMLNAQQALIEADRDKIKVLQEKLTAHK